MKTILITGASRGIGAACAELAAQAGYAVALNYHRNHEAAQAVAERIRTAGGTAELFPADVGAEEQVVSLFRAVDARFGRLDALVNNAGVIDRQMRVETMTAARINRMLTTNVTGPFLCAREAVLRMSTRRGGQGGAIVNVSSRAAVLGSGNSYVDYAASKAALDTLTLGLAQEVANEGIRVNGVRPGLIYTDIHADGGEPGRVERLKTSVPMQRGGQPEEVARAILWLLSPEASYTTASFIDVSGGR
ncbi:MAG TPA: SDR family oxidoreductase [Telluria sp.]|nr:SDR family oxidoreductase [Telluria sp.]